MKDPAAYKRNDFTTFHENQSRHDFVKKVLEAKEEEGSISTDHWTADYEDGVRPDQGEE